MKEERQEQLRHLRFKYIITTKLSSKRERDLDQHKIYVTQHFVFVHKGEKLLIH